MIVIVLLSSVMIAVPTFYAFFAKQGVRLSADQLCADLQLARMMAIRQDKTCSVVFNSPAPNQYMNALSRNVVDLASYRGGVHFLASGPDGSKAARQINFVRRGMATPAGSVFLADQKGENIFQIKVLVPGGISASRWNGQRWEQL